jgi:hypothetical protein
VFLTGVNPGFFGVLDFNRVYNQYRFSMVAHASVTNLIFGKISFFYSYWVRLIEFSFTLLQVLAIAIPFTALLFYWAIPYFPGEKDNTFFARWYARLSRFSLFCLLTTLIPFIFAKQGLSLKLILVLVLTSISIFIRERWASKL